MTASTRASARPSLARTMARVEQIRDLEFEGNVTLEVITRDEYRNRSTGLGVSGDPWNEQVWEGLLLVGEGPPGRERLRRHVQQLRPGLLRAGQRQHRDRQRLGDADHRPGTLAHELVHALQDQEGGLAGSPPTQDRQLRQPVRHRGRGELRAGTVRATVPEQPLAVPGEAPAGSTGWGQATDGVFLVIYQPYATGPQFVDQVRQSGGWDAVTGLYDAPPNSTEQVIHPGTYPDEQPVTVTVDDRSSAEWSRFDHDPVARHDRRGVHLRNVRRPRRGERPARRGVTSTRAGRRPAGPVTSWSPTTTAPATGRTPRATRYVLGDPVGHRAGRSPVRIGPPVHPGGARRGAGGRERLRPARVGPLRRRLPRGSGRPARDYRQRTVPAKARRGFMSTTGEPWHRVRSECERRRPAGW